MHLRIQCRRVTFATKHALRAAPVAPALLPAPFNAHCKPPPLTTTRRRAWARKSPAEAQAAERRAGVEPLHLGEDTAGRYCLIEMLVPPGGGPPPHRHDFEESFTVLAGEIEVTFRSATAVLHAGATANIPANAPHQFRNT